ncbi:rod shape-determining protein MreD [Staphylococcus auricularis]
MRALYYFLIGVLVFYLDAAISLVVPMHIGTKDFIFVPHLTLMYILLLNIYRSFGVGLIMAVVLGLVTDLYFGSFYGLYLFGYILFVVIFDQFFKTFYRDRVMLFALTLMSVLFFEIYTAIIYGMLDLITFDLFDFVLFRLIPTMIINGVLLIIMEPLLYKFFHKIQLNIDSKKR